MKINFEELEVVRGDIEIEDTITKEQYDQFNRIITRCKTTPKIKLTLKTKERGSISMEFINWEKRFKDEPAL